jgi:integrase
MAMIEERDGDLQFRARVRRKGHPEQSATFHTRAEAVAWAAGVETDLRRGLLMPSRKSRTTTFGDIASRYRDEISIAKKSAASERSRIETLIKEFGAHFVGNITREMVAAFRDKRLATPARRPGANAMEFAPKRFDPDRMMRRDKTRPGRIFYEKGEKPGPTTHAAGRVTKRHLVDMPPTLSPQSVVHELNTLSVIIEHARSEWGIQLVDNPAKIRRPKLPAARNRRASELELQWLYSAAAGYSDIPGLPVIVILAVETGMRLGELVGMTWPLVNLNNKTVSLPMTKNGEARGVPLSPFAVATLNDYGKVRRLGSPRLFTWGASDAFQKVWKRCLGRASDMYVADCEAMGTEPLEGAFVGLHFHDLRHEAASRFSEMGFDPIEIAQILGHKTIQMTSAYVNLRPETLAIKLATLQARSSVDVGQAS